MAVLDVVGNDGRRAGRMAEMEGREGEIGRTPGLRCTSSSKPRKHESAHSTAPGWPGPVYPTAPRSPHAPHLSSRDHVLLRTQAISARYSLFLPHSPLVTPSHKLSLQGRAVPSTVRQATASSAAGTRANLDTSNSKPSASAARTLNQTNVARLGAKAPKATTTQLAQSRSRAEPSARVRATTTLKESGAHSASARIGSTTARDVPKARPPAEVALPPGQPDTLQLAAQSCAWSYMTSTVEEGLSSGRTVAQGALKKRKEELDVEEADIAESRVRYEAERLLDFYDELNDTKVAEEVAAIIMRFKDVEHNVSETTAQTLRLTSAPLDDTTHVNRYTTLLDTLDALEEECQNLRAQVDSLADAAQSSERRLPLLLNNLSDILQGHEVCVGSAKRVVQCCKENYRMGIGTLTLK
ncbi:hypothetical protein TRAPUB_2043 [Trametes pubescens]|uniref:Uncharacterized protein n=1 Tax=Trametes pubescens TaxID=154538 RepID=A0A1M2VHQ1_TRAPU|nr:hypothetical protein TRAPUB_2043 [Trametes pubescens]